MQCMMFQQNHGEAAFSKPALALYDALVLHLVCRHAWLCPNQRVLAAYARHATANHLEVGVGTGYFLDSVAFPAARPRVALLDLNANCLERTARRIARYAPEVHRADVLAPIRLDAARFDSLCANYVLHCLPGGMAAKERAIGHLAALLNPGRTLFGATLLHEGVPRSGLARVLMRLFNATGTLSNRGDSVEGLREALEKHLDQVQIEIVGCVALFSGRAPQIA
jgi:ubiquinone/menaquinone biosynthesis C-methylase UbiE